MTWRASMSPKKVVREFLVVMERAEAYGGSIDFEDLNTVYAMALRCFSIAQMKKIRQEAGA